MKQLLASSRVIKAEQNIFIQAHLNSASGNLALTLMIYIEISVILFRHSQGGSLPICDTALNIVNKLFPHAPQDPIQWT